MSLSSPDPPGDRQSRQRMTAHSHAKHAEDDNRLIATKDLGLSDVPKPDAPYDDVYPFCLSFDGYQWASQTRSDLHEVASSVEARGYRECTLDELRATAFIRQRDEKWSDQGWPPFEELIKPIYRAVEAIRGYLADRDA